jgi:hypothetical protein
MGISQGELIVLVILVKISVWLLSGPATQETCVTIQNMSHAQKLW